MFMSDTETNTKGFATGSSESDIVNYNLETQNTSYDLLKNEPNALYDIGAERALLGILLLDNTLLDSLPDSFVSTHIATPLHYDVFNAIVSLSNKGIVADPITLSTELSANEQFKEAGGQKFLLSLIDSVMGLNITDYALVITDFYLRRELNKICLDASYHTTHLFENTQAIELIDRTEQQLYNLSSQHIGGQIVQFNEALKTVIHASKEALNSEGHISGVTSGFTLIDRYLGGFNRSDLIILAGRPSMGKTALAINIAFNAAKARLYRKKEGSGVIFFSLEMSAEQLAIRLLSCATCISAWDIKRGNINRNNIDIFTKFYQEMEKLELYIEETPNITSQQIKHKVRKMQVKNNIGLIIIDYLQLMSTEFRSKKDENRVQEVSSITRQLKGIAKDLNIPIIALSQLSRAVEQREDKRPQLADLRDSGSIEQDADIVMFVYREAYYKGRQEPKVNTPDHDKWEQEMSQIYNRAELIIAKHRNGPISTIPLFFDPNLTKFGNLKGEQ